MELRHPFDVYVKFWETMSGTRKETLPAPEAAYQLEEFFCGALSDSEEEDDNKEDKIIAISSRPVTVLMLDEIDFLVTKKVRGPSQFLCLKKGDPHSVNL